MFTLLASLVLLSGIVLPVAAANPKYVFAHFMAPNAYSYEVSDWQTDISEAQATGIDGFVLNIQTINMAIIEGKIDDAFSVAEPANFYLIPSFDFTDDWAVSDMERIVSDHANSTSAFWYNGGLLVSTYGGDSHNDSYWSGFKSDLLADGIKVTFAPAFTTYRDPSLTGTLLSTYSSLDGFFNWWSWPDDVDANLTTTVDLAYQQAAETRGGPYIMSVSPWQFKELGGTQDWVELSDTLWYYRWLQAIQDVNPDIVEIVTWNDYAESHYIGDINPNVNLGDIAPLYVDGFVHSPWRYVAQYFIPWYRTGQAPPITDDQVIFWYRSHPKDVTCAQGDVPRMSTFPVDAVFALALISDSATVTLDIGSNHYQWDAPAGASMGSVPFPTEHSQIPFIQIITDSGTTSGYGSMYVTQTNCTIYNFNPWVGIIQ
ncbi:glycoside hydrolase family 71 protein [Calocera viscosa TUFC12733]|uniref:Glycoside hydrolase family 71 protein n=1 Tax=Calocera viscosa (strain TUFC12733) TaxID=1330018 RepID=A0A167GAY6_CALVF|nr:glycoside hydrolase family 71 protein [Calocera viscosa TUFC12733]